MVRAFDCLQTKLTNYMRRMSQASKVPMEGVKLNRDLVRDHVPDFKDVEKLLARSVS